MRQVNGRSGWRRDSQDADGTGDEAYETPVAWAIPAQAFSGTCARWRSNT
ncbi:hypothetical protein [Janthinobacterium sp. UMAB-56]|nr:hypothetical protein [Janthinobacterium sp. UMAB-56]